MSHDSIVSTSLYPFLLLIFSFLVLGSSPLSAAYEDKISTSLAATASPISLYPASVRCNLSSHTSSRLSSSNAKYGTTEQRSKEYLWSCDFSNVFGKGGKKQYGPPVLFMI